MTSLASNMCVSGRLHVQPRTPRLPLPPPSHLAIAPRRCAAQAHPTAIGSKHPKSRSVALTEVEPPRPATEEHVAAGPAIRCTSPDGDIPAPATKTLYDSWVESVAAYPDRPCLGHRVGDKYEWLSYQEAGQQVADVSSALAHLGLGPHSRASIFGANSPEWMTIMQAANRQSIACVPLYDVLGDHTVDYIIDHSESSIVFVAADKLPVLAKALPPVLHQLKGVVWWGKLAGPGAPALEEIREMGAPTYSFEEFVGLGRLHPASPVPPHPQDICTIMYTSGTTGTPKGVLLTHRAVASEVTSLRSWLGEVGTAFKDADVYLSFLPLAHIYGRVVEEALLSAGGSIGYWSGEARGLPADIRALQPTVFCSVPRVLERFESMTLEKVAKGGALQRGLFHWAYKLKLTALKAGAPWSKLVPLLTDLLVFKSVSSAMLGSRIRLVSSGGAPLAQHVEEFMRVTSCAAFVQGYGLTETCAATFCSDPNLPDHFYTVGLPQSAFALRLEAVPDMGYGPLGTPPCGEVLVKGSGLFSGYYKNEEETRKAMDADGWFHTGDVGELTPGGALRIIDRKKNMFKLSQGEYIAVEKIEGVLGQSKMVDQIWVHGNSYESCLVAVVVPSRGRLTAWAKEQGIAGELPELCRDSQVARMLQQEVATTGKQGGLKSFEVPRALLAVPEPFSVDNELLTPTFELRRQALLQRYGAELEALYTGMRKK